MSDDYILHPVRCFECVYYTTRDNGTRWCPVTGWGVPSPLDLADDSSCSRGERMEPCHGEDD